MARGEEGDRSGERKGKREGSRRGTEDWRLVEEGSPRAGGWDVEREACPWKEVGSAGRRRYVAALLLCRGPLPAEHLACVHEGRVVATTWGAQAQSRLLGNQHWGPHGAVHLPLQTTTGTTKRVVVVVVVVVVIALLVQE